MNYPNPAAFPLPPPTTNLTKRENTCHALLGKSSPSPLAPRRAPEPRRGKIIRPTSSCARASYGACTRVECHTTLGDRRREKHRTSLDVRKRVGLRAAV